MGKVKKDAAIDEEQAAPPPRRLCSEIQLFDLCELERCHFRDGRYCTDPEMLARFEAAAEPEDRPSYRFDESEEDESGLLTEERDEDDDDYSVFDDEDQQEQDEEW